MFQYRNLNQNKPKRKFLRDLNNLDHGISGHNYGNDDNDPYKQFKIFKAEQAAKKHHAMTNHYQYDPYQANDIKGDNKENLGSNRP